MENIIVPNPIEFEKIKNQIKNSGSKNIHILADFDRTLTCAKSDNGKNISSIISILRDGNYLAKGYAQKAHALFDKYHPIEIDTTIPTKEKKEAMNEWWTSHIKLLIESGLNKKDLEKVVEAGTVRLKDGSKELFEHLNEKQIPIIIMSSSGIGDLIPMFLEKEKVLDKNVHIITNLCNFDENGKATGVSKPIITVMNKDETAIQDHPETYSKIKNRKNVILMGDSLGDLGMITGFEYDNLIKIGFLNDGEEQNKKEYEANFDIIITKDNDFSEINKIIKELTI